MKSRQELDDIQSEVSEAANVDLGFGDYCEPRIYNDGKMEVCLDGLFSLEHLKKIVAVLEAADAKIKAA